MKTIVIHCPTIDDAVKVLKKAEVKSSFELGFWYRYGSSTCYCLKTKLITFSSKEFFEEYPHLYIVVSAEEYLNSQNIKLLTKQKNEKTI